MSESESLPWNFGGLEEEFSNLEKASAIIWPISYEGTVSYGGGTGKGAEAVIEASRNMELYDEELQQETFKKGLYTAEIFEPSNTPEEMMKRIKEQCLKHIATGKKVVSIGGEHSITGPLVEAHKEKFSNFTVVQIDAHADLRKTYDGTHLSHAAVMRRVVEEFKIPAVQCGIRSLSIEEAKAIPTLNTTVFWAKDIVGRNGWWNEAVDAVKTDNVYLTIDIDGLDSSLVPETGTPEPGGLGWYETVAMIRALAQKKNIIGMDLVEYSYVPDRSASAFLTAKLLYKCLGYILK